MTAAVAHRSGANTLNGILRAHPVASALLSFAAFEAVHAAMAWNGGRLLDAIAGSAPASWRGPILWGLYAALALLPVAALGWWRATGLTRRGRARAWPSS